MVDKSCHEIGEPHQISDPNKPATLADDDLRIGRNDVGPLPRHCAHAIFFDTQQEPRPVAGVPLADADQLPSPERVERVRDAHKARACGRRASSSLRVTSASIAVRTASPKRSPRVPSR